MCWTVLTHTSVVPPALGKFHLHFTLCWFFGRLFFSFSFSIRVQFAQHFQFIWHWLFAFNGTFHLITFWSIVSIFIFASGHDLFVSINFYLYMRDHNRFSLRYSIFYAFVSLSLWQITANFIVNWDKWGRESRKHKQIWSDDKNLFIFSFFAEHHFNDNVKRTKSAL